MQSHFTFVNFGDFRKLTWLTRINLGLSLLFTPFTLPFIGRSPRVFMHYCKGQEPTL